MPSLSALPKKLIPSKLRHVHNNKDQPSDPTPPHDDSDSDMHPFSSESSFTLPSPPQTPPIDFSASEYPVESDENKAEIANLIAQHGTSSACTSWLEFSRYKIWRPSEHIPSSSFKPVQGYLRADPYVFAWGNPLVSDPSALEPTCIAFWEWVKSQDLRLVWCCVDGQMEKVLGKGTHFGWSTLSCIVEDVLDPHSVVELANAQGGGSEVKDFKKNLRRAEREDVQVREIKNGEWSDAQKKEVEDGIIGWKKAKSGVQLASTSFQPWLDSEHRRYFVAEKDDRIVGILILTSIGPGQYQIKNQASFPDAPRGTSEHLIYRTMLTLEEEGGEDGTYVWDGKDRGRASADSSSPSSLRSSPSPPPATSPERPDSAASDSHMSSLSERQSRVAVTFGITASETITPVENISGWRISWLGKTYNKVVGSTGVTRRGDFRNKFHTDHMPMYVCYPTKQGFGLDCVSKLLKCLRA
ncbi:hypothetical protein OF83DRAFT_1091428 [Amylostereum chailletii]|nr:hypothetical protein OF83DRAFT_1091428 [Amylostereum chailletii]